MEGSLNRRSEVKVHLLWGEMTFLYSGINWEACAIISAPT